ncbi:MAG TPA: hypothetical protein VGK29_12750 [Paludibaculum sp.]
MTTSTAPTRGYVRRLRTVQPGPQPGLDPEAELERLLLEFVVRAVRRALHPDSSDPAAPDPAAPAPTHL